MSTRAAGPTVSRTVSIDVLRGITIVAIALDHVRDFLTSDTYEPEDLAHSDPTLFATRWVTHFCAPIFCFLAGTAASLMRARSGSTGDASAFLWKRGIWLIVLEWTIVDFAWTFQPWAMGGVIFMLGVSMLVLAAAVYLPRRVIGIVAAVVIVGHDVFDAVSPAQFGPAGWAWTVLHVQGDAMLPGIRATFFVLYPLVPWIAVMGLGYVLGALFDRPPSERQRVMLVIGAVATFAFIVLRAFNAYGNPPSGIGGLSGGGWTTQGSAIMTAASFLNVERYPPSLQYLLMTLGPALIVLAFLDRITAVRMPAFLEPLLTFGRVPMFFYTLHLYAIHLVAIGIAVVSHQPVAWLLHGGFFLNNPQSGYGQGLPLVYATWIGVVLALYVPSRMYANYNATTMSMAALPLSAVSGFSSLFPETRR